MPDGKLLRLAPLLADSSILTRQSALDLANPRWEKASARILIARLSSFRDVAASSSHYFLFSETRQALPEAYIDFSFFPTRRDRDTLSAQLLPWFYGLASLEAADRFDLIMLSNATGPELINLPRLLSETGMALLSSEREAARRSKGEKSPIIILGGSNAAAAGSIFDAKGGDGIVDGIFFGEAEGRAGRLAAMLCDSAGTPRSRLERAADLIPGFWICGGSTGALRGSPPSRAAVSPAPLIKYPALNSEEALTARLQISGGCPGMCSFCLEGWDRLPYRELPLSEALTAARALKVSSGAQELELYSFNFNTHSDIFSLIFGLNQIFHRVKFMSQRIDLLASTPSLLDAELAADKRSFTLGIEGISEKMRAFYAKSTTRDQIERVLKLLLEARAREIKLFYIIAGGEDQSDLEEFAAFIKSLKLRRAEVSPGTRIIVSAGWLVRLPFTPLSHAPLCIDESRLRAVTGPIKSACETNAVEFRLAADYDEYFINQVLALGGGAILPWLMACAAEKILYEDGRARTCRRSLEKFCEDRGILGPEFLAEKPAGWEAPLGFVIPKDRRSLVRRRYEMARVFIDKKSCLGSTCSDCGACETEAEKKSMMRHKIAPVPSADFPDRIRRLLAAKEKFARIYVCADLPDSIAGARPEYRCSWIARLIFSATPTARLFAVEEPLVSKGSLGSMLPSFTGLSVFSLAGPDSRELGRAATEAGLVPIDAPPSLRAIEVELVLAPIYAPRADEELLAWLAGSRVGIIERKKNEGRFLEAAPSGAKKNIFHKALLLPRKEDEEFRCSMRIGSKARLSDWLDRLGPLAASQARIRIVKLD